MKWLSMIVARILFYPTLWWNQLLCRLLPRRKWWDRVDDRVLVGALPLARHVPALYESGVRAVVNTCREYDGPTDEYDRAGIVQLHVPTVDFTSPSLEDIERSVAFIQEHVERGETVFVHCKAGRGRSATVVLCWLIEARGMTPANAQSELLKSRPHVLRSLARRRVVRQFAARRAHGDGDSFSETGGGGRPA